MKKKSPYQFFSVASDIMVLREGPAGWEVLLIQRKHPPFQLAWALPGGFVDQREDALTAARRELQEETGLHLRRLVEFGSFSAPDRDPRGRTLTVAYYTLLPRRSRQAKAGDDAKSAAWFQVGKLPRLAFDHRQMIAKGLARFHHDRQCRIAGSK